MEDAIIVHSPEYANWVLTLRTLHRVAGSYSGVIV